MPSSRKIIAAVASVVLGTSSTAISPSLADSCDTSSLRSIPQIYAEIAARVEFLRELAKSPMRKTLAYSVHDMEVFTIVGVPSTAKWVPAKGQIWRHYKEPEVIERIAARGQIVSGIVPYVIVHPGLSREVFQDLSGVFLTKPGVSPKSVGLEAGANSYVDFTLDAAKISEVLQIESGIFLVPGHRAQPEWMLQKFRKRRDDPTFVLSSEEVKLFDAWRAAGGTTATPVPIRVNAVSIRGKVTLVKP